MTPTTPEEMAALDRRVAELRGWRVVSSGLWAPDGDRVDHAHMWSPWDIGASSSYLHPCTDARQAMALLGEMPCPDLAFFDNAWHCRPHWHKPTKLSAAEPCVAIVKAWIAWKEGQS